MTPVCAGTASAEDGQDNALARARGADHRQVPRQGQGRCAALSSAQQSSLQCWQASAGLEEAQCCYHQGKEEVGADRIWQDAKHHTSLGRPVEVDVQQAMVLEASCRMTFNGVLIDLHA